MDNHPAMGRVEHRQPLVPKGILGFFFLKITKISKIEFPGLFLLNCKFLKPVFLETAYCKTRAQKASSDAS
jgi:hypothetical protein